MAFVQLRDVNVDRMRHVERIAREVISLERKREFIGLISIKERVENLVWFVTMVQRVRMKNIVNVCTDGLVLLVTVVRDRKFRFVRILSSFEENVRDLPILPVILLPVLLLVVHRSVNVQDMRREKIVQDVCKHSWKNFIRI